MKNAEKNTVLELCAQYGLGATALSRRFGIPIRTVENWMGRERTPPDYVVRMMKKILKNNL